MPSHLDRRGRHSPVPAPAPTPTRASRWGRLPGFPGAGVSGRALRLSGAAPFVVALSVAGVSVFGLSAITANRAAAAPASPERPPDILSWRHQFLQSDEYQALAARWQAFVKANPGDARALVEWGNALRYSGSYDAAREKYRAGLAADSTDAASVEAFASQILIESKPGDEWKAAHAMLVRSMRRHPEYAKTYYMLWVSSLRAGDRDLAGHCLEMMVQTGDMPRALVDYGANTIEGAPPGAIILTNGDNDTYLPLAYQRLSGRRPDVTIANRSLLNTAWYIRYLKGAGLPITLTDAEIDSLRYLGPDRLIADQVVENLGASLAKANARPVLYSVTVPGQARRLRTGTCEGLLVPVLGPPGGTNPPESGPGSCNWERTRRLLDAVYRTDGLLDPAVDWKRENALSRLACNYAALGSGTGDWLASSGRVDEAGAYYLRAIRLLAFHGYKEAAAGVVEDWAKAAPRAPLLPEARSLLGN